MNIKVVRFSTNYEIINSDSCKIPATPRAYNSKKQKTIDIPDVSFKPLKQKKAQIEPETFKWCKCHILLSNDGIYPDKCFKDCI